MSQVSMWLFPLVVSALVSIVILVRAGFSWTWGFVLQQCLVLGCAAAGFITMFMMDSSADWSWTTFWTGLGWVLLLIFGPLNRILLNKVSDDLGSLRPARALKRMSVLRLLLWGPSYRYWHDLALVVDAYSKNEVEKAQEIIARLYSLKRLNKTGRENLATFVILGKSIVRDWQGIIEAYEAQLPEQEKEGGSGKFPYQIAARAYAETGNFEAMAECMEKSDLAAARLTIPILNSLFVALYAISGACDRVIDLCKQKVAMTDYTRLYWQARSQAACGNAQEAIELYEQCLAKVPADLAAWHERVTGAIAKQEKILAGEAAPTTNIAEPSIINRLEAIRSRCVLVTQLVRPTVTGPAVKVLFFLIVAVYSALTIYRFLPNDETRANFKIVSSYAFQFGALSNDGVLKNNAWWQLITYQFLHGNETHLALNAIALLWFGRLVENIFGSAWFVFAYFTCGILSGLLQIVLSPSEVAVGASGAIMGIFGVATVAMFRLKNVLPPKVRRLEFSWLAGIAVAQIVLDQVMNFVSNSVASPGAMPHIAGFAHMGGLLSGVVIGSFLPMRKFEQDSSRR